MDPNPRLVRRFTKRQIDNNKLKGQLCRYYPYMLSAQDNLEIGALVEIVSDVIGDDPNDKYNDNRAIEVQPVLYRYFSNKENKDNPITVFIKDLSPGR